MAYYFSQKQIFSVKTIKKIYSKQCGELILKFRGDKNNNRPLIPATAHFFFSIVGEFFHYHHFQVKLSSLRR